MQCCLLWSTVVGYYVDPTIVQVTDPKYQIMQEEIFGPMLAVYVYPEKEWESTLRLINDTSPYGLTGSLFAHNRDVVQKSMDILCHAAGNFYIYDKFKGFVVGQQPFGGPGLQLQMTRLGSPFYLLQWMSPLSIKESLAPLENWRYPSMDPST